MKYIYIKTPNGDRYADSVISNGYELSKDKFGWSITQLANNITYSERNASERDMFEILYNNNFTLHKAFNIK